MARVSTFAAKNNISQVASKPAQSGQGFAAIAELAKMGAEFLQPKANEEAREAGAASVSRDADGRLQVEEKSVLGGEYADIHNAAAFSSYLAQRKIDMRSNFAELSTQYEFDPQGFETAANAYIESIGNEGDIPSVLRDDILNTARAEAGQRFSGLYADQTRRTQRASDTNTSTHRDMLADDYINLVMQGDMEGAEAVYAEMASVTAARGAADYISETDVEGEAYLSGARGAARAAHLTRRLEDLSGARSITDEEREEIQGLLDDPDITPQMRSRLYSATQGRLRGIDGRAAADAVAGITVPDAVRNYGTQQGGIDPAYYDNMFQAESGGNANARNPLSSATGLAQFTTGTWSDMMKNHPDLNLTANGRTDPAQARRAAIRFTEVNARYLSRNGLSTSNGNLYAAHFLGAGGAVEVLSGRPDQLVSSIVSEGVVSANPFLRGMTVSQFQAWSARKGGGNASDRPAVDYDSNRVALNDAGVPLNNGSEFFAATFSVDAATSLYQADPDALAADVLPENLITAVPVLSSMTVSEARAWSERQGTVKASDIAARRSELDMIEDEEVRSIAVTALNEHYNQRRRAEEQAAAAYAERVQANDGTLSVDEIRADHSMSDQAQDALVSQLQRNRREQLAIQETISNLADDSFAWNSYDSGQRGDVNDAYVAMIGDSDPMSPEGMAAAAQVTDRAGFMPKRMFDAVRGAVASQDPEAFAGAMEFVGQMMQLQPGAIAPHGGRAEVQSAFDDFKYYSGFMGATEAAARVIENNLPENRARQRNLSDLAKEAVKGLRPDDVINHMSEAGLDVNLGTDEQQAAVMGDYEKLFNDHFTQTGDVDLAKNRALSEMSRIYGPNTVTGDSRLMRFPPQNFYPNVRGQENWMTDQVSADVTEWVYGIDAEDTELGNSPQGRLATVLGFGDAPRIESNRINLDSDEKTRADIAAGRSPTYSVTYEDDDGMLQVVPGRYEFTPPAANATTMNTGELNAARDTEAGRANVRMWIEHLRADPDRSMSIADIQSHVRENMDQYSAAPPPDK